MSRLAHLAEFNDPALTEVQRDKCLFLFLCFFSTLTFFTTNLYPCFSFYSYPSFPCLHNKLILLTAPKAYWFLSFLLNNMKDYKIMRLMDGLLSSVPMREIHKLQKTKPKA